MWARSGTTDPLQSSTAYSVKVFSIFVLGCCCVAASAQRLTILLDPARGGTEDGGRIDERTSEKQVTLDIADRLRSLLQARDFDVVMTRGGDVTATNDARAAMANQAKPLACVLLHATAAGKGLHLFTSSLPQTAPQGFAVPWDEAQAAYVQRSQRLAGELETAFQRAKMPVSSGHTWVRPLDNMECPAVAIEIAPDGDGATAADHNYQTRIADTLAGALLFWRGHTDVVQSIVAPPPVLEPRTAVPINRIPEPGKGAALPERKPVLPEGGTGIPRATPSGAPGNGTTSTGTRPRPATSPGAKPAPSTPARQAPPPAQATDGSSAQ